MSKTAPRVQFNFLEEECDEVMEHITDNTEDDEIDSLAMPEPVEREAIEPDNIFDEPEPTPHKSQILKELVAQELPKPKKVKEPKPVKLTKSGRPRKPMTEEQKQKLAIGRQKALEQRKINKIKRDEEKALEKEEKELLKKKKQKDFEKLKKEVEEPDTNQLTPARPQAQTFTRKDLEDAQLSAIMSYEKIRSERKKAKQEAQLIEAQKQEIRNKLTKQPGTYQSAYNPQNRFYNCY
mgnify:CR=1 FL=1